MEIEVDQSKLAKALNIVSRVAAGTRATLPILNNVLIRVRDKKATLTATNLDTAVVDFLPTSNAKDGVITVPAKLLAEFVSNLPKGVVKINVSGNKVITSSGKYKSVMNGTPADDFPELPEIDEKKAVIFKMGIDEFKTGISQVMVAVSNDMTRPVYTGVYFNTYDGDLYVVSSAGYRLAERKFIEKVKSEVMAVVPSGAIAEVLRSISDEMEEIEILFNDTQVRFRLGEIEITSNLIDGSFPDYRSVIARDSEIMVTLPREELLRVTKLAALFAREVGGTIVCETKSSGSFLVSSIANEFGENSSEIKTKCNKDGKIILNSKYLIDALNVLEEDELTFGFSSKGLAPIVIKNAKSDNYMHIIMPLES